MNMNLLLTEIRAPAPELAGPPMTPAEGAGEFTRLLRREMLDAGQQHLQVIEFKVIYADSEAPVPVPAAAPELPYGAAWQALPTQDPVVSSLPSVPLENIVPAPAAGSPPAPQTAPPMPAAAATVAGEALPPGGTPLPPLNAPRFPNPVSARFSAAQMPPGLPPAPPAVTPTAAGAPAAAPPAVLQPAAVADDSAAVAAHAVSASRSARDTAPAQPLPAAIDVGLTPATERAADDARPQAAPAAAAARPVADSAAAAPALEARAERVPPTPGEARPAAPAPARSAAVVAPTRARSVETADAQPASAQRPPPAAVAARPVSALLEPLLDARTESTAAATASVTAAAAPAAQPALAAGADGARESIDRLLQPARAGTATDPVTMTDGRPAPDTAAPRQTPASAPAPLPAPESREPVSSAQQLLKTGIDGAPPEAIAGRVPEAAAATTPAAQAASTAAPQAAAPAPGVGPAAAPPSNPLATAEPLTLSRQADAGEWGNSLGERVHYMINQKQNSATIRLDPPALGKLEIQVRVADDATTITIQTQQPQARDLIDAASHRLRDFLQESGYQNVNVDVSQRQDQQQARGQAPGGDGAQQDDEPPEHEFGAASRHQAHDIYEGEGLLDTFA